MKDKEKNNNGILSNFTITNNDLDFVISYIKERQTAILVIMFTDIVGFTRITEQKGEKYAATLRSYHDDILTQVIEKDNAGKVVKYIGDSVMAIFSEPTKAVEVSLTIHDKLRIFNESNPDMVDISVRIGLHMGQVAIENNIQADIFGRHVNRASRIESLAGKGQVFASFPVFDSAKGWLQDKEHLGWKSHGEYFLKGIDKPAEIYEVFNKHSSQPQAPKRGKKKRVLPSYVFIILFMLLGVLGTVGIFNYKKTEVFMFDFMYEDVRTLNGSKLFLDGEPEDHKRLVLTKLNKGKNVLYYDVSAMVRYYTEIDVVRGTNLIEPKFRYFALPNFDFTGNFSETDTVEEVLSKEFSYYNSDGEIIDIDVDLKFIMKKESEGVINNYESTWELSFNGENVGSGTDTLSHDTSTKDYNREDYRTVLEFDEFDFEIRYMTYREMVQVYYIGVWKRK